MKTKLIKESLFENRYDRNHVSGIAFSLILVLDIDNPSEEYLDDIRELSNADQVYVPKNGVNFIIIEWHSKDGAKLAEEFAKSQDLI